MLCCRIDHLNKVRLVLDESGALLDQIAYDAFGHIVAHLSPTTGVVGSPQNVTTFNNSTHNRQ